MDAPNHQKWDDIKTRLREIDTQTPDASGVSEMVVDLEASIVNVECQFGWLRGALRNRAIGILNTLVALLDKTHLQMDQTWRSQELAHEKNSSNTL